MRETIAEDPNKLVKRRLKEIRSFIRYMCQTYNSITPYLMGAILTVNG